ncbi:exo-beta-N-acetylmuramidase NamZ family protein [Alteromonas sp. S015]|uniref:exo-beta-N-acetylmuramidase NamZ family protein n=1 Tax=Alteromonas sp. S015 TaxID=3117401 RepID=UPI002FE42874
MKILTSLEVNKVFRRLTSNAFIAVFSLALVSLSTHVYTSNTDSPANQSTLIEKQPALGTKQPVSSTKQFAVGAERYSKYLPLLAGKRVSLVVNQSALVSSHSALPSSTVEPEERESSNSLATQKNKIKTSQRNQHLLDALLQRSVNVVSIMSPEHGFRGDKGAGEKVDSNIDAKTGLPIHSLYGATKKPTPDMLEGIDVIVFDIQDVGVRFYTYLSTLHYVLEAAFARNIDVIVLDRPNPNGRYVDGPVLQSEFSSFIGMHPIPVLHGMTLGELAQMVVGEQWLDIDVSSYDNAKLTVVPVQDYQRTEHYSLPVAPSPNLPNDLSIRLYPTLCFFEGTDVSIGRGTDFPFQLIGHPFVEFGKTKIPVNANSAAPHPKHENTLLNAHVFTHATPINSESLGLKPAIQEYSPIDGLDIAKLIDAYSRFSAYNKMLSASGGTEETFFTRPDFFDKLAGTDALRFQIQTGKTPAEIRQSWQKELDKFREKRKAYLLYQDTD